MSEQQKQLQGPAAGGSSSERSEKAGPDWLWPADGRPTGRAGRQQTCMVGTRCAALRLVMPKAM